MPPYLRTTFLKPTSANKTGRVKKEISNKIPKHKLAAAGKKLIGVLPGDIPQSWMTLQT